MRPTSWHLGISRANRTIAAALPLPVDTQAAMAVLNASLEVPRVVEAVLFASVTREPALLAAASRAIERVVAAEPDAAPVEILALLAATGALENALRG